MTELIGVVRSGVGDFKKRMTKYPKVFESATGEPLYAGTINVELEHEVPIQEEFRIKGKDIGEPDQDLLFEKCKINGFDAYRIRPYKLATGLGGHGDHILEIASADFVPGCDPGDSVTIDLFRTV